MQDTSKYLIHADITASGVVERNDVVGAVFGQTEGLLGDELDLRDLQDSQKVGRIDVEIRSESGQSYGELTVASGLDRVETAILAAALETIEQVGPCDAEIEVTEIEDVRSAKRREVVDRATELLAEFEADTVQSEDIVETVRQRARVADVTAYEGLPAGPRVADSDAIVVVEGRADVLQLLKYGVKNAIAVEGTNVPEAVADLTGDRTVTAFLDGDRGGDLILRELAQVGNVDYVAVAPRGQSVEDLSRADTLAALRNKVPYEEVAEADSAAEAVKLASAAAARESGDPHGSGADSGERDADRTVTAEPATVEDGGAAAVENAAEPATEGARAESGPTTLDDHVEAVMGEGAARLLDTDDTLLLEGDADDAVELVEGCEGTPETLVLDGTCTQKVLDVAAQRQLRLVVAAEEGQYVKRPTSVQVRTV